jgi:hypothetical protein
MMGEGRAMHYDWLDALIKLEIELLMCPRE